MEIKRVFPVLLIFFLFLINPVSAANEPENLTAVPFSDSVILSWDAVASADNYSVYRYLPSMIYTNETIVLDGLVDDEYKQPAANKAVAFSPNPVQENDYDTFYILRNDTYVFMCADTIDADIDDNDDAAGVYVDFDRDGLTKNVDLNYEIQEDGDVVRREWQGSFWQVAGGSGAIGQVTGAGTGNPVYELWVPISEMPGFTNETIHDILIERRHDGVTVTTYQPRDGIPSDTTNWAPLYITTLENQTFFEVANTTNTQYEVTDLDPFDFYHFGVSATISGTEYDQSTIDVITLNTATYTVDGYVYDEESKAPITNAEVLLNDSYVVGQTETDINGYFEFTGVINDSYTVLVSQSGYLDASEPLVVQGANESVEIYLESSTTGEVPLWLFVLFVLINIGAILIAFGNELEIGIFNIFCSFIATVLSYLNSKILINGQLVESLEFVSTIQSPAYSGLFHYIAIIMGIITMVLLLMFIKERIGDEDV